MVFTYVFSLPKLNLFYLFDLGPSSILVGFYWVYEKILTFLSISFSFISVY